MTPKKYFIKNILERPFAQISQPQCDSHVALN